MLPTRDKIGYLVDAQHSTRLAPVPKLAFWSQTPKILVLEFCFLGWNPLSGDSRPTLPPGLPPAVWLCLPALPALPAVAHRLIVPRAQ